MKSIRDLIVVGAVIAASAGTASARDSGSWQKEFAIANCAMSTTGRNQYFVLEPGFRILLESDDTKVQITVLDKTRKVDGIMTRVVEEREWVDGKLYEVAMNYFAMCESTKDVFYFGEDVDYYKNGRIVRHEGEWLAGVRGAKPGMIMAGAPRLGMKYYQEMAPGVAMDRAEIVKLDGVCETPAGKFSNCMRIKEGTALDPSEEEFKIYAPGIGLIGDEDLRVTKYGFVGKK